MIGTQRDLNPQLDFEVCSFYRCATNCLGVSRLFFSKNNFDEYASFDLRILHSYSCTDHIGSCLLLFDLFSMTLIEGSFPDTATISNISGVHFQFTVGLGCGIMFRSVLSLWEGIDFG